MSETSINGITIRGAPEAGARVVVVGAAGGLGKVLTAACEGIGLQVVAMDLAPSLAKLEAAPRTRRIAMDASDEDSTRAAFDQAADAMGGIDHVFNLVGFSTIPPQALADTKASEWDRVVSGNLRSAFLCFSAARPHLRDGSSIVYTSSAMVAIAGKGYGSYIASKSGVGGLVRALAAENAPQVRVNAVAPSAMLTPFMGGGPTSETADPSHWSWFDPKAAAAVMPMRRLCTPEDVVGPMLFLASGMAGFITGQTLHVSGGRVFA